MDGRINTLLVEDNPGDAALFREMLLTRPDAPFQVRWASSLAKATDRLQNSSFDVVLLDLGLPDSNGLDTFTQFHCSAPHLPVIVLSGNDDDQLALRAVRAGAEDYLTKGNLTPDSLVRSIRYTVERNANRARRGAVSSHGPSKPGRVIGFLGAKGGVGATTVALNAAAAIAKRKQDVILAEIRSSCGTLSQYFDRQPPPSNLSALAAVEPEAINRLEVAARLSKYSGELRVLFGPQKALQATPLSGPTVSRVIEVMSRSARFVVLDLPPEPSAANRDAVRACDFVGLVLEREPTSLAAARIMLDHIKHWKPDALIGAVVTCRAPLAAPLDINDIQAYLSLGVVGLIPPAIDACVLAQRSGAPLIETCADSLIADSLNDLATRLAEDAIVIRKIA
ncbi:MAG: response regulator/pilus assembly protein [bacterium]|nr:response regulator/pilus assembly protein [bacterium]